MKMSNKVYDWLKAFCQVVIPAVATVYWILSGIMGLLPYGEQVVGALVAIDTCIGAILAYSSANYDDGVDDPDEMDNPAEMEVDDNE